MSTHSIKIVSVKAAHSRVHTRPLSSSSVVQSVRKGQSFPLLSESRYYYRVQLLRGKTGWLRKRDAVVVNKERTILGWLAFGNSATYRMQLENGSACNVVSPRWFSLVDQGNYLSGEGDAGFVDWAHAQGLQVWPLLGNRFDPGLTRNVLESRERRTRLVEAVRDSVTAYRLDGINVDFENVDPRTRAAFVLFIQELKKALPDTVISVDVTRHNDDPFFSGSYDRAGLGQAADYIALMAYDEHWGGSSKAGSVASLPWVEEGVRLLMKDVPSHKILLGVPFYTREWITDSRTNRLTSHELSIEQAEQWVAARGAARTWDAKAKQHYVEIAANGLRHQMWLEDQASMLERLKLVDTYRLGGVAIWHVGLGDGDIWDAFRPLVEEGVADPEVHTVRSGDSLWLISRQHNVTVDAISRANGLTGTLLTIGQKLVIPK